MFMSTARRTALLLALIVSAGATILHADQPAWYFASQDVALSGYDAVAYFTESKAVKGMPEFEHRWNGARWRFASAANRDRFRPAIIANDQALSSSCLTHSLCAA